MFMPNDVFILNSNRIRILWSNKSVCVWIDIDSVDALPKMCAREELEHFFSIKALEVIPDPHVSITMSFPEKGSKSEKIQDRAWNAIKNVVEVEPDIYVRKTRGPLVQTVLNQAGVTKQTAYRWLRRYWQLGMCKNSLNAQYIHCGASGKERILKEKKTGAPRTMKSGVGINVDEAVKKIFRVVIEKCLLNEDKYEFDYAYNQLLIAFGVPSKCKPEDLNEVPTERQFKYFYQKEYSSIEVTRRREGEINYAKDFRPVLNTSTSEVAGPGSRYQIDATIADIYLVSEQDRNKIIGRPTLYFVIDVFSRAIVGMYVGLENASWVSAMGALINTVENKVDYCKKFGIDIDEGMWPTAGLPEVIIGDRGEMLGRHIEILCKAFNVEIENTPPYRADWKGIVERYFRTIQVKMKPFVEGYVTKNPIGKKRHGHDYRQDGVHTLYEFTQIIINIVLYYNNEHQISTYDADPDLPENIPFNPLQLWNWGIEWRTGRLRRPQVDLTRINLLPHTDATISELGIKLFGCYYTCNMAINRGWFERNYQGIRKISVAYDFYSANSIYIRPSDNYEDYIEADLTERSRCYRDLTMWEVWARNKIRAKTKARSSMKQRAGAVNLARNLEEIAKTSNEHRPLGTELSKNMRIKGIRDNKTQEREYERNKASGAKGSLEQNIHNVIQINRKENNSVSFKLPTRLAELLEEENNDNDQF